MSQDAVPADPLPLPVGRRLGRGVEAAADGLCRGVEILLAAGIVAGVALNCANVLGRYVFGYAIVGADEILVYGMIAVIFLGAVPVTWRDAHLRLDVLIDGLPPRLAAAARRGAHLAIMLLCAVVGWASAAMAAEMAHFGQRSLAAGLPMVLPHGAVATGLWLAAAMAGLRALGLRPPPRADEEARP